MRCATNLAQLVRAAGDGTISPLQRLSAPNWFSERAALRSASFGAAVPASRGELHLGEALLVVERILNFDEWTAGSA